MSYDPDRARQLLRAGTGQASADFRDGQEQAIRHVVNGLGRLLVIQKTGWGKSFVYFIATKLLRESGKGPALLVSPLLSLMRNQIDAARRMGLRAEAIHSGNVDDWDTIERALAQDLVDILLISPERLSNEHFQRNVLGMLSARISLLVVDEAHCISDWGHDFRPNYRLLERTIRSLPANLGVLATTATANNRVMDDLGVVLGPGLTVLKGDLNRPSLVLQTIRLPSRAQRLAWLARTVPKLAGTGIIYTLTVHDAEQVARWLSDVGLNVKSYTGQSQNRPRLEAALMTNSIKALVATTALGMGYDKPDLGFVIHYQSPGSVVAYYQQVGRAGRALAGAYAILLSGEEDDDINDYFIQSAFPTESEVEEVLEVLLAAPGGLTASRLESLLSMRRGRIEKVLQLLSLESPAPVFKHRGHWFLTTTDLKPAFWERARRLTEIRQQEQREMKRYIRLESGHMAYLLAALDGAPSPLTEPALPQLASDVDEALEGLAHAYLKDSPKS